MSLFWSSTSGIQTLHTHRRRRMQLHRLQHPLQLPLLSCIPWVLSLLQHRHIHAPTAVLPQIISCSTMYSYGSATRPTLLCFCLRRLNCNILRRQRRSPACVQRPELCRYGRAVVHRGPLLVARDLTNREPLMPRHATPTIRTCTPPLAKQHRQPCVRTFFGLCLRRLDRNNLGSQHRPTTCVQRLEPCRYGRAVVHRRPLPIVRSHPPLRFPDRPSTATAAATATAAGAITTGTAGSDGCSIRHWRP